MLNIDSLRQVNIFAKLPEARLHWLLGTRTEIWRVIIRN
jgi:hypothetical protein